MSLNLEQREAIKATQGPVLVIAGAGTGKTRVITEKMAHLMDKGVPASGILAVTFTNKAAREMKHRLALRLKDQAKAIQVSTFHQFGLNFIRKHYKEMGLRPRFSILDDGDTHALLKELAPQAEKQAIDIDWIKQKISQWKNSRILPNQAISQAQDEAELMAAHAFEGYIRILPAYNAVDFDDLIGLPLELLEKNPMVQERLHQQLHYLLVDEYQDTNSVQYQLIKTLVKRRQAFTLVGDDDQSIYAWRGAQPENLALIKQDFPELQVIKLEQNYRSTQTILNAANHLIQNNPHIFEKKLRSVKNQGEPIRVVPCQNEEQEADFVTNTLLSHKLREGKNYSDFAILYRSNHQARVFELKLQALQIPYRVSGGTSFFARTEIKDLLAYLKLVLNPEDDLAFLRVINTPTREIGLQTIEKISHYAQTRKQSLFNVCDEFGLKQSLGDKAYEKCARFKHWLTNMQRAIDGADNIAPIRQLIVDIEYYDWIKAQSPQVKTAQKRIQNVEHLLQALDRMIQKYRIEDPNTPALELAIQKMMLRDLLDQQDESEQDKNEVSMMTLHSAKGLEFTHVFLVGMEDQLLPHKNSIEANSLEEERRLFYVGITRAIDNLCLSYAKQRKSFADIEKNEPSRFLAELPENLLSWQGKEPPKTRAEQEAIAQDHIKKLRALLLS
jgi:ATP-dependent DNA helicase Rep